MPMNRIQFRAGLSRPAFLSSFGTSILLVAAAFIDPWPERWLSLAEVSANQLKTPKNFFCL